MEKSVDDDTGEFEQEVSDERFVRVVSEREPAGTTEIADAVGMTRPGAYRRLQQLDDAGRVDVSRIGGSLVWRQTAVDAANAELRDRVVEALDSGEYKRTPERTGAAVAVVEELRDRGKLTSSEAVRIATEAGVKLGTTGQWWSETGRRLECVKTTRGSNVYEWVGGDE